MGLSKKEISILIEIIFSIVFVFIFLPYFYENQFNNLILMDDLIGKIIEILIFTVIYFSIAYSLLEFIFKKNGPPAFGVEIFPFQLPLESDFVLNFSPHSHRILISIFGVEFPQISTIEFLCKTIPRC